MLRDSANSYISLIFCVGQNIEIFLKVAYLPNKTPLGVAVIPHPPFSLGISREAGSPVDDMGGLCSPFQILKSQWRQVPLSPITGCNDPWPVGMVVWSYREEASAVEKLRHLVV